MGTDVHGGFIKVTKDVNGNVTEKQPIKTNWGFDRDYTLFAILADVRNGYGFAGCYRYEPLQPISSGRGLPDWLTVEDGDSPDLYNVWYGSKYACNDEQEMGTWLGDHSYTYVTLKEILEWDGWDKKLQQGGVVEKEHYDTTIALGLNPEHWSGGIWGGDIVIVEEDAYESSPYVNAKATHIDCRWECDLTLAEMKEDFIEEIKRLTKEYGEDVYLILGFDS